MTYFFICLCERSEANSREGGGLRSISSALFRWDISLPLNMTYFLSPIGALRHFAYAADAPLLSLSRHFPRFSGGIYPEGGSKICLCERSEAISREGGGLRSIFSVLFQGDCRGTLCLAMTTKKRFSLTLNMTRKSGAIRLRIAPLNTARIIACYSCFAGVPQYGHTPSLSE